MIIAIDGPAGSGKSTVSKKIAQKMNLFYLDTGAMYRAVTYTALKQKIDLNNKDALIHLVETLTIKLESSNRGEQKVLVNDVEITQEIRLPPVTKEVKHIASIPEVRKRLVELQRRVAENRDVILEGRDTTTVVFPHADFKFYLDANQGERARRRFVELQEKGVSVTLNEIIEEQTRRDESDINRHVSPLKKAHDAIVIDTTNCTIAEVVKKIITVVKKNSGDRDWYYALIKKILIFFAVIVFKLRAYGSKNIPSRGGFIIASNHASHLDPIMVGCKCPRHLHYFARTTLFAGRKAFVRLIESVHGHPIHRDGADKGALKLGELLLQEGKGIALFPEGTRTKNGSIGRGKSGIGFLACRTGVPVIPAYIHNSFKAFPCGAKWFTFVPITVTYGKPLYFNEDNDKDVAKKSELYQKTTDIIMDAIQELKAKRL